MDCQATEPEPTDGAYLLRRFLFDRRPCGPRSRPNLNFADL